METTIKEINLTEDEFDVKFTLLKNHFEGRNGSFDDCAFETYPPEIDYVLKVARETPKRVWTVLDCDGKLYICSGYHLINRISYLISNEEVEDGVEYEVELEDLTEGDEEEIDN